MNDEAQNRGGTLKLFLGIAALIFIAVAFLLLPVGPWLDAIRGFIATLGWWGPAAFVAVYVLCTVCLIPGSVLTLGAGSVFGLTEGTLLTVFGANLGALCAFLLARTAMHGQVEKWAEGNARFSAVNDAISKSGFKIVLLLRLSPVFPFTLLNYLLGLTRISLLHYVLGNLIGMLPGTVAFVYIGSLSATLAGAKKEGGTVRLVLQIVGLAATLAATMLVTRMARQALKKSEN